MHGTSEWNADRAKAIIDAEKHLEGPMLPILHALMAEFGHVPDEATQMIAEELNLSRAEVHGVITFYHDFRREPAGQHVFKLCRAEACQAAGGDAVAAHAEQRLGIGFGETSRDGRCTLEAVYCLGLCAQGPSAMINDRIVANVSKKRLDALIDEVVR